MRKLPVAFGCLVLLVSLAACDSSGGGGSDFSTPYNFNGTWTFTQTLVDDPQGWWEADTGHALNSTWAHDMIFTQNGTSLSVRDTTGRMFTHRGTCDPETGTFTVTYTVGTVVLRYNGQAEDDGSMSGEFNGSHGPDATYPNGKTTRHTWTAELGHR